MSFLLDTCTLSELTRPRPDPGVAAWFETQDGRTLFLSVLSVGEIERGIALLRAGRKKTALSSWLATLRSSYGERVLPVDDAVAITWGRLAAGAERTGAPLGVIDGLIAATAIHHGYTIVTRNTADFAKTGVALLNPWGDR